MFGLSHSLVERNRNSGGGKQHPCHYLSMFPQISHTIFLCFNLLIQDIVYSKNFHELKMKYQSTEKCKVPHVYEMPSIKKFFSPWTLTPWVQYAL